MRITEGAQVEQEEEKYKRNNNNNNKILLFSRENLGAQDLFEKNCTVSVSGIKKKADSRTKKMVKEQHKHSHNKYDKEHDRVGRKKRSLTFY